MHKKEETLIAEAVKSMFNNDPAILGIVKGKPKVDQTNRMPRQYEFINELFGLKIADSLFFESLHSTFYDIHSYKYVNDPSFCDAFRARCRSQGIPQNEIDKACRAIYEVNEDLKKDHKIKKGPWDERSAGWHPDLDGIRDVTQGTNRKPKPEQPYSGGGSWPINENIEKPNKQYLIEVLKRAEEAEKVGNIKSAISGYQYLLKHTEEGSDEHTKINNRLSLLLQKQ